MVKFKVTTLTAVRKDMPSVNGELWFTEDGFQTASTIFSILAIRDEYEDVRIYVVADGGSTPDAEFELNNKADFKRLRAQHRMAGGMQ